MVPEPSISARPADPKLTQWFAPILQHGSTFCAANVETQVRFLRHGDWEIPLTVNDAEWQNSWLCSPSTQYVHCAQEEILRAIGPVMGQPACLVLRALGHWMRSAELNKVVVLNHWLLSTAAWPQLPPSALVPMIRTLQQQFPNHAYVFRSLNARESAPLMAQLESLGAHLIPSRQIWYYPPGSKKVAQSRDFRNDIKLVRSGDLEVVPHDQLTSTDLPQLTALYRELYLGKYSPHNPDFTSDWLHYLWQHRLLTFTGLRRPGSPWLGVEACGELNGVLTSPIVGYSLKEPPTLGLYRRLAAIPVLEARRRGLPLNLSAGVGRFKALRGGEPVMEYLAILDHHLPKPRRTPWKLIHWLSQNFLAPYAQKHRL
jgi:hypothetical protein